MSMIPGIKVIDLMMTMTMTMMMATIYDDDENDDNNDTEFVHQYSSAMQYSCASILQDQAVCSLVRKSVSNTFCPRASKPIYIAAIDVYSGQRPPTIRGPDAY